MSCPVEILTAVTVPFRDQHTCKVTAFGIDNRGISVTVFLHQVDKKSGIFVQVAAAVDTVGGEVWMGRDIVPFDIIFFDQHFLLAFRSNMSIKFVWIY